MKLVAIASLVLVGAMLVLVALTAPGAPAPAAAATPPATPAITPAGRAPEPPARAQPPAFDPRGELPAPVDPGEKRRSNRAELEASGRTSAAWTRGAADVFYAWQPTGPAGPIDVQFGAVDCFAGGCVTTASYRDLMAFNAVNQALPDSERFRSWPGSKMRTPPEQLADGRVIADWVLLPPNPDDK